MLIKYFHYFALLVITASCVITDSVSGSTESVMTFPNDSIARFKREFDTKYLVFPQGSNVQLVYCLTIGILAKPAGTYTIGITAGLAWELPHRNILPYKKSAEVYHRRSRRELYRKIELMLKTQGKDGKACVLKAICRAARRACEDVGKGSFLEEILHVIFTLPGVQYDIDLMSEYERTYHLGENCEEAHAKCPDVF